MKASRWRGDNARNGGGRLGGNDGGQSPDPNATPSATTPAASEEIPDVFYGGQQEKD